MRLSPNQVLALLDTGGWYQDITHRSIRRTIHAFLYDTQPRTDMPRGLEPSESTGTRITVVLLGEEGKRERIHCNSFTEAIGVVKAELSPETVAKIENRDQEVVFTS